MTTERLDLKIAFACNNHCRFCVRGGRGKVFSGIGPSRARVIAMLKENRKRCRQVVFTGGEVTLRRDLLDLVAEAREMGYQVQLQTNARMFSYGDLCFKAVQAGVNSFAVSMHGHTARLHDSLTGVPGSFVQTSQALRNLVSLRCQVVTNTVINHHNYKFLPEIARFLLGLGVVHYQLAYIHIMGFVEKDLSLIAKKSLVRPFLIEAIKEGYERGALVNVEAFPACLLGPYASCSTDKLVPVTLTIDGRCARRSGHLLRRLGRVKRPACRACVYDPVCAGPWREYPRLFGWDEFVPVSRAEKGC